MGFIHTDNFVLINGIEMFLYVIHILLVVFPCWVRFIVFWLSSTLSTFNDDFSWLNDDWMVVEWDFKRIQCWFSTIELSFDGVWWWLNGGCDFMYSTVTQWDFSPVLCHRDYFSNASRTDFNQGLADGQRSKICLVHSGHQMRLQTPVQIEGLNGKVIYKSGIIHCHVWLLIAMRLDINGQ